MAFKQSDRVQETTVSTGTGSITLAGAVTGFQTFAAGLQATSGTCWYTIGTPGVGQWEVGLGTVSSSTTLARTTILASSNAGSVVDLAAGTKAVFMDIPASVFDLLNLVEISVASATTCDIGAVYGGKIVISGTTTITSLGASANKLRFVRFSGALTLTHNGTSLILPGAQNIVTVAGDTAIFVSDASGNWRCHSYDRASGRSISGIQATVITLARDLTVAGGSVAYTGVGFKPTALIAIGGEAVGYTYTTYGGLADNAGTGRSLFGTTAAPSPTANFLLFSDAGVANFQAANVASYDVDGFTLTWLKTGSPTGTATVYVLCLR
jgi:hypothetical protein